MRNQVAAALAALLCVPLAAQRDGRDGQRRPVESPQLAHFEWKTAQLVAPSVKSGQLEYAIYLPKGYADEANAETEYPWILFLHGMRGSWRDFHRNDGPQILDAAREKGDIQDVILIAISASPRPLYLNGLTDGDWEDAITKDLVEHVEATYRVAKDSTKRAIMGVSIGGMAALRIGLRHPDLFGAIASHSGVVPPAEPDKISEGMLNTIDRMERGEAGLRNVLGDPIDLAKWKLISPVALVRDMEAEKLASLRIWFDVGTDDRYGLQPGNEALREALEERKVQHRFDLVQGGQHAWGSGSTQRQLPKSFAFIGARFEGKPMPEIPEANAKPAVDPAAKPAEGEPAPRTGRG